MHPNDDLHPEDDDPALDEEERRRRRRRREREDAGDAADGLADAAEGYTDLGGSGGLGSGLPSGGGGRSGGSWCGTGSGGRAGGGGAGGCDACDCNLTLLHLSSLLVVAAAVVPDLGTRSLVCALIRGYQRWLTRFTPRCPSTPSCSAFALAAVRTVGPRRGLRAAAHRIRRCAPTFEPGSAQGTRET